MPDYKELHKKWKKAKDAAKSSWDFWSGMYMTVNIDDVKYATPPWPKFNMDLGPSLDKLEKGKDVEKSKVKALKAVKQYQTDIANFLLLAGKVDTMNDKTKAGAHAVVKKDVEALEKVRAEIENVLNT